MFQHRREVPAAWERRLAQFAPEEEHAPWLKLVWMAGEDYEPVQRWCIYEMFPVLQLVPADHLADLRGLSPRDPSNGNYKSDPHGNRRWHSHSTCSLQQWELFQVTKCYPRLFWIIQGEHGGHKWLLDHSEQVMLRMSGVRPYDTPLPGDLPYAPFDERVMAMLAEYNDLQADQARYLEQREYRPESAIQIVVRKKSERQIKMRERLQQWLTLQVKQTLDENWSTIQEHIDRVGLPNGDRRYNENEDDEERAFIEGA